MQNAEVINSDNRPLPDGWMQHYESSKQIWYYVQTNVMPPKVSFTHPADILPPSRRVSTMNATMEMPRPNPSPSQPPPIQNPPRLSAAQRLYASSNMKTGAPIISSSNIQNLSTSPGPPPQTRMSAQFPTSPPLPHQDRSSIYTSNVQPSFPQAANRPLPGIPPYPDNLNGTAIASRLPGSQFPTFSTSSSPNFANSPSPLSTGSTSPLSPQYGANHHAPHRTQSLQPPHLMPPNHGHLPHDPIRAKTYAPGQGGFNANMSTSGPRATPHLVTTARPPAELNLPSILQSNGLGNPIPSPPSMDLLSPLSVGGQSLNSSMTTPSPPASSLLFAPQTPNSIGSPISSPATSPPLSMSPTISSPGSNSSTITPENFNKTGSGNAPASSGAGRILAQAMIKFTGSVLAQNTGIPSGIITGIGDLVTNPKIINMMKSAFSKSNTGVAESDLQAVMQGRPNANYQAVISALIRQQQLQQQQLAAQMQMNAANGMQYQTPPQQSIDYQTLIAEIQRLQMVSQAQAQLAQQQATQQQALAQLQANSLQQQQQQQAQAQALAQQKHQQAIQEQLALAQQQQAQQQQAMAQQQAAFAAQMQQQQQAATQQFNSLLHQQQATNAQNSQQHSQQQHQTQQGQNSYAHALSQVNHLIHDMTQQQQQPQQQQSQQPSMTDLINSAFGGNGPTQQQQPQQPSMTDMINSVLGGNGSGQGQPPAFDPSTLYTDPTGGGSSTNGGGGGGGIFDTIAQTLGNASNGGGDPSQSDTSGFAGFVNGFNQAFSNPPTDPSFYTAGFDLGSLDASFGNNFNTDNSWSQ